MTVVAWFEIVVGIAIVGLWTLLLATGQVPQIAAGDREIWFHLAAESVTSVLLIGAGLALLSELTGTSTAASGLALGALLYTTIASPGYYADRRDRGPVAIFAVLVAATVAAAITLVASAP